MFKFSELLRPTGLEDPSLGAQPPQKASLLSQLNKNTSLESNKLELNLESIAY